MKMDEDARHIDFIKILLGFGLFYIEPTEKRQEYN